MIKKKIALFDIDKTIYEGYIIFPLADYFLKNNIINQSCIKKIYNNLDLYKKGEINYESTVASLNNNFAEGLKGILLSSVLEQTESFLAKEKDRGAFFSYLEPTINILRKKAYDIYFATGEPQFVGFATTKLFNVSGFVSLEFETKGDFFTGKVKKMLSFREEKLKSIKGILKGYDLKKSFAFGDSEGDIEMLNFVEKAVCINPTDGLKKVASEKGWIIAKPSEIEKLVLNEK